MIDLLATLVAFGIFVAVAGGGCGAAVARGDRSWALATAPAAAALVAGVAVALSVLTRAPLLPWLVLVALAGGVAAWRVRATATGDPSPPGATGALVGAAAVALLPLLLVDHPATGTDARSIWWLHAAWFRAGGDAAREAMDNPAYAFSHPSYPPVVPGVIAAVWHGVGAYDREVALRVGQLLTAAGAAALGFFTARVLRLRAAPLVLTAMGVTWLGWSAKLEVGLQGLYDLTWALFLVTAAVLLLAGDGDRRTVVTGALFAAAGALTKTEAQVAALLLVLLVGVRHRRDLRRAAPAAVAVLSGLALWAAVIRPNERERGDWSKLSELLTAGSEPRDRLLRSLEAFRDELGLLVAAGVVIVLLVVVLARRGRVPLRQPGLVALLALAAGSLAFTVVTFTVRPEELDFLLSVTAYRTAVFLRLVVVVDVVLALVAGWRAWSATTDGAEVERAEASSRPPS